MGQHKTNIIIGAAAITAATGLGVYYATAQDTDPLNTLLNDLGALMQPANGNGEAPAPVEILVADVDDEEPPADAAPNPLAVLPDAIIDLAPLDFANAALQAPEDDTIITDLEQPAVPADIIEPAILADFIEPAGAGLPDVLPDFTDLLPDPVNITLDNTTDAFLADALAPALPGDAADAAFTIAVPVATAAIPAPRPAVNLTPDEAAIVAELEHINAMRVQVEINHAYEILEQARVAAAAGKHQQAQELYENANLYLPPDAHAAREETRAGIQEALYRQAMDAYRNKSYEDALKKAELARDRGHPRAGKLVADIKAGMAVPPEPPKGFEYPSETPQYAAKREEIQDLLRRSRNYFRIADYEKALLEAEKVLRRDPYNTQAQTLRNDIARRKQVIYDIEYNGTRNEMLNNVTQTWTAQGLYAVTTMDYGIGVTPPTRDEDLTTKNRAAIEQKMKDIIIPDISFRDAKIQDVKSFLEDASREYDDPAIPQERRGVNFALILENTAAPTARDPFAGGGNASDGPLINFAARYTSLHTVLNTIMDIARMKYTIRDNIVTIMPVNRVIEEMFTRSYVVNADLLEIVTRAGAELQTGRGGGDIFNQTPVATAADDDPLRGLFQGLGVEFPIGATINYIPSIGRLRVTNTAENLAKFDQVIVELNVQTRMVEIEARFVEVGVETLNSLGFEWSMGKEFGILPAHTKVGTASYFNSQGKFVRASGNLLQVSPATSGYVAGGGTAFNQMTGNMSLGTRFLDSAQAGIQGISTGPISDRLINIGTEIFGTPASVFLHMISQTKGTDLLSAPKVLTRPGMPAVMKVTREFIYPRSFSVDSYQSNGDNYTVQNAMPYVEPSDFNFDSPTDVGVILEVTPEVSSEGQLITMNLNPRVVELNEWIDYGYDVPYSATSSSLIGGIITPSSETSMYHLKMEVPIFSRREVQANISIYNGATVVMGGMITEARTKVEDKIPFLGDIPYLGQFFRSTIDRSEKRNLLIFVTARLVDPAGRPVQVTGFDRTTLAAPTANN